MNRTTLTTLSDATGEGCGGKAATLAALSREGLPVPEGFVVPYDCRHSAGDEPGFPMSQGLREAVAIELGRLGDAPVAVRSSAANEDTAGASAAGQYESIIGVRGVGAVCDAITACWETAHTARVADYWSRAGGEAPLHAPKMAVLVQHTVDADVSGVMFTSQQANGPTRIEASWGLGLPVVGGTVAPDTYEVEADGAVDCTIGWKETRTDLNRWCSGITSSAVSERMQTARSLDDDSAMALTTLGSRIAAALGGPQDVEWAMSKGEAWILQSRPITAALPSNPAHGPSVPGAALGGTPGSHGIVTASARVVHGPSDFPHVRPGEIVICPYTDPAWTPLFTVAAGVVTEMGGALSHAAIVAREYGIPAVFGVAHATTDIQDGDRLTLNGTVGTITVD